MITRRKRIAVAVAVMVAALPARAIADDAPAPVPPPWHFAGPVEATSAAGRVLQLPPGYYLAEPAWSALDVELRRAQDAETRLRAENLSLRKSAASDGLGWRSASLIFAVGVGAGILAHRLASSGS